MNMINKKQILLFGLSANPPSGNGGHQSITEYFAQNLQKNEKDNREFNEIWILPVYSHAFSNKGDQIDFDSKLEMCKLNFETLNNKNYGCKIYVKDFERSYALEKKKTKLYSADMLETLREKYRDCEFSWFMGGDTIVDLFSLKTNKNGSMKPLWGRPEYIISTTPIYYTERLGENRKLSNSEIYKNIFNNSKMLKSYITSNMEINKNKLQLYPQNIESLRNISSTNIRINLFKYFNYGDINAKENLENDLYVLVFNYIKSNEKIKKYYSMFSIEILKKINSTYFNNKNSTNKIKNKNLVKNLTQLYMLTENNTIKKKINNVIGKLVPKIV